MTPRLREFLRFCAVGSAGFVVDAGLLLALVSTGVSPVAARLVSVPAAVVTTWWLNRIWTFARAARVAPHRQLWGYLLVQGVGALTNFAVFATILALVEPTRVAALSAMAVGSGTGLLVNFTGVRRYIFRSAIEDR